MKVSIYLRYINLLLATLLAGSSISFLIGMGARADRNPSSAHFWLNKSAVLTFGGCPCWIYLAFVIIACLDLFLIRKQWKSIEFLLVVFSLVCILDDQIMTFIMDLPLSQDHYPWQEHLSPDWMQTKSQWINFMYIRCTLLVASFVLLLASTYLRIKPRISSQRDAFAVV